MDLADTADREAGARVDEELIRHAILALNVIAGPALQRTMERARDTPLPVEGGATDVGQAGSWDDPRGVNRALARLVHDLAPALGDFPSLPVVHDLISAIGGDSPTCLVKPVRKRGQKDGLSLSKAARRRFVLAVYFSAGREGESLTQTLRRLAPDVSEKSWERMRLQVAAKTREAVREAGRAGDLSSPAAANAARNLQTKWPRVLAALSEHTPA